MENKIADTHLLTDLEKHLQGLNRVTVLCQNVADIMRFRIQIHEHLADTQKTLFNLKFQTPNQWIAAIASMIVPQKGKIAGPFEERSLLLYLLHRKELRDNTPLFSPVIKQAGMLDELHALWNLYQWKKDETRTLLTRNKKNPFSAELISIFTSLEKGFERFNVTSLAQAFKEDPPAPDPKNPDTILYLLPTQMTELDQIKLGFIETATHGQWNLYLQQPSRSYSKIIETFKTLVPEERFKVTLLSKKNGEKDDYHQWVNHNKTPVHSTTETSENTPKHRLRVWQADTPMSQYAMIFNTIRDLYDQGVPDHKVHLLYTNPSMIPLLEKGAADSGLYLNHPEQKNINSTELFSLVTTLYHLLGQTHIKDTGAGEGSKSGVILIGKGEIEKLFLTPLALGRDNQKRADALKIFNLLNGFLGEGEKTDLALLSRKIKQIRSLAGSPWEKSIDFILRYCQKLPAEEYIVKYTEKLWNLTTGFLEALTVHEAGKNTRQIELLEQLFSKIDTLQYYFQQPIPFSDYLLLLNGELERVSSGEISSSKEKRPVTARRATEGLHSMVDYLFVCDLNSGSFPATRKLMLEADTENKSPIGPESLFFHTPEEQTDRFIDSTLNAKAGIVLSFSTETSPVPAPVIFDLLHENTINTPVKKSELIENIPDYTIHYHRPSGLESLIPSWHLEALDHPLTEANIGLEDYLQLKRSTRFDKDNDGRWHGSTGKAVKEAIGVTSLEKLATCPQYFLFDRMWNLGDDPFENHHLQPEKAETGTFFHLAARNIIQTLQREYPQKSYQQIAHLIQQRSPETLLSQLAAESLQQFQNTIPVGFRFLRNIILERVTENITRYFIVFFEQCKNGEHPLSPYHPLYCEAEFKELHWGELVLKGKIDRVDYYPEKNILFIADYKTGSAKSVLQNPEKAETYRSMQLQVYMKAASQMELPSAESPMLHSGWLIAGQTDRATAEIIPFIFKEQEFFSTDEIDNQLIPTKGDPRYETLVEISKNGSYFATPRKDKTGKSWDDLCAYCPYGDLCDRSPFPLAIERLGQNSPSEKYNRHIYRP